MTDAAVPAQNYANHRKQPLLFVLAGFVLAVDALVRLVSFFRAPALETAWAVVPGVALLVVWALLRRNSLALQDRIIRLEMRVRLERVLPPDRRADIARLELGQLIALRFASDAELPALVEEVLAKGIRSRDEIKQKVKDWQADGLRV